MKMKIEALGMFFNGKVHLSGLKKDVIVEGGKDTMLGKSRTNLVDAIITWRSQGAGLSFLFLTWQLYLTRSLLDNTGAGETCTATQRSLRRHPEFFICCLVFENIPVDFVVWQSRLGREKEWSCYYLDCSFVEKRKKVQLNGFKFLKTPRIRVITFMLVICRVSETKLYAIDTENGKEKEWYEEIKKLRAACNANGKSLVWCISLCCCSGCCCCCCWRFRLNVLG